MLCFFFVVVDYSNSMTRCCGCPIGALAARRGHGERSRPRGVTLRNAGESGRDGIRQHRCKQGLRSGFTISVSW